MSSELLLELYHRMGGCSDGWSKSQNVPVWKMLGRSCVKRAAAWKNPAAMAAGML